MTWRQIRYLLDSEVQSSDDATKILKLPLSNVIHTLYIKAEVTNGATNAQDLSLDDVVDKIEVIGNGSEVVYSLTPQEARLWGLLDYGFPITEKRDEGGGEVQHAVYPILFGQHEWDPNFWLPCSKFTDLELRIKYSPTISVTAFATGTVTLTVIALMTMGGDPGPYQGTLRKTTIYDFTTVASGDETIDLPRRLLYKRGLIYAYEAGVEDGTDITKVKFSLNNDELIPFNLDWEDLQEWNRKIYDLHPYFTALLNRADGDVVHTHLGRLTNVKLTPAAAAKSASVAAVAGDAVTLDLLDQSTQAVDEGGTATYTIHAAVTADTDIFMYAEGLGLPYAVLLPFSEIGEDGVFDPTKYDMVQLILTQGGAGADAKVSLEEIISYGGK